jgi:hypothetical protein
MDSHADVLIVGAGAAGLATAIFTARHNPRARVVALDSARKIGAKILVSGGGRCNVTNVRVAPEDFYGGNPNVIRRILSAFSADDARSFFNDMGVALHEEEFGKLFPDTNSARTVVDALLREADRRRVAIKRQSRVTAAARTSDGFTVTVESPAGSTTHHCRRLVLATGGLSLPKTGSDGRGYCIAESLGHTIASTTPALDPLVLSGSFHRELSGVAHDLQLTLHTHARRPVRVVGPALWTHFGLSGPAALNMSRFWNRAKLDNESPRMTANFAAGADFTKVDRALVDTTRLQPKAHVATALKQWLPARVATALVRDCGIDPDLELGRLTRDQRRDLIHTLTERPIPVTTTRGYTFAEVTAGGIPLSEINPKTMESRPCPGLYLVGEILDVDGRLGGFNFQWAWSSAFVAGNALTLATSTAQPSHPGPTPTHPAHPS